MLASSDFARSRSVSSSARRSRASAIRSGSEACSARLVANDAWMALSGFMLAPRSCMIAVARRSCSAGRAAEFICPWALKPRETAAFPASMARANSSVELRPNCARA